MTLIGIKHYKFETEFLEFNIFLYNLFIKQITGDSGVKLQYTHCRLYNLNRLCGVEEAKLLNLNLLTEPEAQNLIYEILKYSETILHCNDTLEACGLVNYLFGLW